MAEMIVNPGAIEVINEQIVTLDNEKQSVLTTKDFHFSDFNINTSSAGGAKYHDKTLTFPTGYTKALAVYIISWSGLGAVINLSLQNKTLSFVASGTTHVGDIWVRVLFAKS